LVVVGRQGRDDASDWRFAADPGALALESGRPLLVVPPQTRQLPGKRVVIAWKDTREARRAVWDALPFLVKADEVLVVAVGENARQAGALDTAEYLEQHGVKAKTLLRTARDATVADELLEVVRQESADLLVSGVYGHGRLREWAFGGVSRDLLDHCPVCCLMAH
jgi:nucleotide-binding universal stress UspA family protein